MERLTNAEIKEIYAERFPGQHFFDRDTVRFFRSKIHGGVRVGNSVLFITSEQYDDDHPRLFTVRCMFSDRIRQVGAFQGFETLSDARAAMKDAATGRNPGWVELEAVAL